MLPAILLGRSVAVFAWLALISGVGIAGPPAAAAEGNPCDLIEFDPGPPPPRSEPTAGGSVTDTASGSGIAGVTVVLNRCELGADPVAIAVGTTGLDGRFAFTAPSSGYYFVEAIIAGPLVGRVAASPRSTPPRRSGSTTMWDLDLSFQDTVGAVLDR